MGCNNSEITSLCILAVDFVTSSTRTLKEEQLHENFVKGTLPQNDVLFSFAQLHTLNAYSALELHYYWLL
jgi:hypothetical protein